MIFQMVGDGVKGQQHVGLFMVLKSANVVDSDIFGIFGKS